MTFLNPLDVLIPQSQFNFPGHLQGPGVSLGRILGARQLSPFLGGGVWPEGCIDPPSPELKAHPPRFTQTNNSFCTPQVVRRAFRCAPRRLRLCPSQWLEFQKAVIEFDSKQQAAAASFVFQFYEGSLVQNWRAGGWLLLDEINLASSATLERLSAALELKRGSLYLSERGDTEPIPMHPNFRLFACMNPPTDVGKKDLPPALRSRFTEIYVPERLDRSDVAIVVQHYIANLTPNPPVDAVVDFYLECISASDCLLTDGNPINPKPNYTLRTLSAALTFTRLAMAVFGYPTGPCGVPEHPHSPPWAVSVDEWQTFPCFRR